MLPIEYSFDFYYSSANELQAVVAVPNFLDYLGYAGHCVLGDCHQFHLQGSKGKKRKKYF
jgi:hypothetical protein